MEQALRAADSRDGLALKFRLSEGGSKGEHDPYADYDTVRWRRRQLVVLALSPPPVSE